MLHGFSHTAGRVYYFTIVCGYYVKEYITVLYNIIHVITEKLAMYFVFKHVESVECSFFLLLLITFQPWLYV